MNLQKFISLAALTATFVLISPTHGQAETTGNEEDTGPEPYSYLYFVAPLPNASYPEAPALVDIQIAVAQNDDTITDADLYINDVVLQSQACAEGCYFVGVELEQGVHELRIVANTGDEDTITVYVAEEPPSDTGDGDTAESGDTGDGDTAESGDIGEDTASADEIGEDTGDTSDTGATDMGDSGCEVVESPSPWGLLALPALLLLPALRRRDD